MKHLLYKKLTLGQSLVTQPCTKILHLDFFFFLNYYCIYCSYNFNCRLNAKTIITIQRTKKI